MTNLTKAGEALKIETINGRWYVMLQSPVHGRWMPVGEWLLKEEAIEDLAAWADTQPETKTPSSLDFAY
jgi:hypothetical protein